MHTTSYPSQPDAALAASAPSAGVRMLIEVVHDFTTAERQRKKRELPQVSPPIYKVYRNRSARIVRPTPSIKIERLRVPEVPKEPLPRYAPIPLLHVKPADELPIVLAVFVDKIIKSEQAHDIHGHNI